MRVIKKFGLRDGNVREVVRMRRSVSAKNGYEGIVDNGVWGLISRRCRRGRSAGRSSGMSRIYSGILQGWTMNLRRQKMRVMVTNKPRLRREAYENRYGRGYLNKPQDRFLEEMVGNMRTVDCRTGSIG